MSSRPCDAADGVRPSLEKLLEHEAALRRIASCDRVCRTLRVLDSTHVQLDGRRLVNFASNDYLGLTHHPRLVRAAQQAVARCGVGSGASPLVSGHSTEHHAAELAIAQWKQAPCAVLLPSGYQSAHAVAQALAAGVRNHRPGLRFLLDKLCHASLIDAVGGSRLPMRVFGHNRLAKLARLLADAPVGQLQVVVTESIFSMDGDAADLAGLAELKARYGFVLVLDEAHASGVYGPGGAGYAAECGLAHLADITIVTLSKAAGLAGGAVCASRAFCEALVNSGRALMYSTSLPPATAAAAVEALGIMRDEPGRQQRVRELARRVRNGLADRGVCVGGGDSPIIPVILGEAEAVLRASERLLGEGMLVVAIRPPTVPRGTSRLRITLSCDHTDEEVGLLIESVSQAARQTGAKG